MTGGSEGPYSRVRDLDQCWIDDSTNRKNVNSA